MIEELSWPFCFAVLGSFIVCFCIYHESIFSWFRANQHRLRVKITIFFGIVILLFFTDLAVFRFEPIANALAVSTLLAAFVHLFSSKNYQRNFIFYIMFFIGLSLLLAKFNVTTGAIKQILKGFFLQVNSTGTLGTTITNISFAIVAFVISIATGMVLTTVKDAEKRMKDQIDNLDNLVKKQMPLLMLLSLSTKYGSYYEQKLLAGRQDSKTSLYCMLVNLFRAEVDNTVILQKELETIAQCATKVVMLPNQDAENIHRYLELLAEYHNEKNPDLARLCLRIRNGA